MKLLLVDGHYYAYRSFYAIRNLSNAKGEPTNALYGMAKALRRMVADVQPDRAAVIMDGGLPAHRMELHAEYKAQRAEMPDDLSRQMRRFPELIPALGFPYLCVEGEEADDLLAAYTVAAEKEGHEIVLATNDKDLMQLVGPQVRIYQPGKEAFELLDAAAVEAKWGVPPNKIGDVLALTGDSVDNIAGVPGVGPKTAAGWIREFGSLDGLLAHLGELKSERHRTAIEAALPLIERNRSLVALRTDLPLPQPIGSLVLKPDPAQQIALFTEFNFRSMLEEARKQVPATLTPKATSQGELF